MRQRLRPAILACNCILFCGCLFFVDKGDFFHFKDIKPGVTLLLMRRLTLRRCNSAPCWLIWLSIWRCAKTAANKELQSNNKLDTFSLDIVHQLWQQQGLMKAPGVSARQVQHGQFTHLSKGSIEKYYQVSPVWYLVMYWVRNWMDILSLRDNKFILTTLCWHQVTLMKSQSKPVVTASYPR